MPLDGIICRLQRGIAGAGGCTLSGWSGGWHCDWRGYCWSAIRWIHGGWKVGTGIVDLLLLAEGGLIGASIGDLVWVRRLAVGSLTAGYSGPLSGGQRIHWIGFGDEGNGCQ